MKTFRNKKVLLRERKRHTAHRVVSTPYVGLTGYPPPVLTWPGGGGGGVPRLGTHPPPAEYPLSGYPHRQGTPLAGYPPSWTWQGTPRLLHGILGNVAKHYGIWVPPPLWTDRQTRVKTLPSRRTTYAGGKNSNNSG